MHKAETKNGTVLDVFDVDNYYAQWNPDGGWIDYWQTNQQPLIYLQATTAIDPSATLSVFLINYQNHWPDTGYIVSAADPSGPWVVRYEWSGANPNPNPAVRPRGGQGISGIMAITSKPTSRPWPWTPRRLHRRRPPLSSTRARRCLVGSPPDPYAPLYASTGTYDANNALSLTSATSGFQDWNGWMPDEDWAMYFTLRYCKDKYAFWSHHGGTTCSWFVGSNSLRTPLSTESASIGVRVPIGWKFLSHTQILSVCTLSS